MVSLTIVIDVFVLQFDFYWLSHIPTMQNVCLARNTYIQDPDSFKEAKLSSNHNGTGSSSEQQDIDDEDGKTDDNPDEDDVPKDWDYIRVDGLGFIPGLCCPHHDRVQSNGVLRAHDFDEMILRHPTEVRLPMATHVVLIKYL